MELESERDEARDVCETKVEVAQRRVATRKKRMERVLTNTLVVSMSVNKTAGKDETKAGETGRKSFSRCGRSCERTAGVCQRNSQWGATQQLVEAQSL